MLETVKFQPHIRMLWSNTVDVLLERSGQNSAEKIGSFTTYGKIMSFVMRFFFAVQFEQIQIEGRIHFVRPKEWERLRQGISSHQVGLVEVLNKTIEQVKQAVQPQTGQSEAQTPSTMSSPNPPEIGVNDALLQGNQAGQSEALAPKPVDLPKSVGIAPLLPQPPVQQKINVLSLYPYKLRFDLDGLEAAALGDEFQPIHNPREDAAAAVLFTAFQFRVDLQELESRLAKYHLSNIPTAVVFCGFNADLSEHARPTPARDRLDLPKKYHQTFHLIGKDGVTECEWNEIQCKRIKEFLRDHTVARA